MLSIERHEKIINLIKQKEKITITELSTILNVSLNTVRTDVTILAKKGIIIRVHGGIALPSSNFNAPVNEIGARYLKNIREKKIIAELVMQELYNKNVSTLFMDSSTSVMLVAELLGQERKPYTIITNFVNIAQMFSLHPTIKVIVCGGEWWGLENCTIGKSTINDVMGYHVDVAFIGCTAIDLEHGLSNAVTETVPIKQAMIKNAKETWVLCDSSKFNNKSLMKILDLSKIHKVFTDKNFDQQWLNYCKKNSIQYFAPSQTN